MKITRIKQNWIFEMVYFPDDIWRKIINDKSHLEWLDLRCDAIIYDQFYKNVKNNKKSEWRVIMHEIHQKWFGGVFLWQECFNCRTFSYYTVSDCYCKAYTWKWQNILDNINSARINNKKTILNKEQRCTSYYKFEK